MSDCIEHGLREHSIGYAYKSFKGKRYRLHRLVYCQANGCSMEAISGLVVRHSCDNARCINPKHLIIGTQADNIIDCIERKRNARGSFNGQAKLTKEIVSYCRDVYKAYDKNFGGAALARRFNVDVTTLHDAIRGDTWRD